LKPSSRAGGWSRWPADGAARQPVGGGAGINIGLNTRMYFPTSRRPTPATRC
jgi:hypothetical protein